MNKIDYDSLKQFDLTLPGNWIKGEDRDQASQTRHIIDLIQSLFNEAAVSYALFEPITAENVQNHIERDESPYERCLNVIFAKTFVFALDGIGKLLYRLSANLNPPKEVIRLYKEYKKQFGHLNIYATRLFILKIAVVA